MKIFFDVREFYYLAQYLPVYHKLRKKNISCRFIIYQKPDFDLMLKKAVITEGLDVVWVADKHKALACYLKEKPDWVIFGNAFHDLGKLHTVSKSAQFGHAIGIKKSYYTKSSTPMTIRFLEGERRLEVIKKLYPEGNYLVTGFAKLDPLYNNRVDKIDLCSINLDPSKKTILYAPTFYPSSIECFPDKWPEEFNEFNLIVKPHFFSYTKKKYQKQRKKFEHWARYENVYLPGIEEHSLLPFMATADLLISEASSSLFEFAALDKPVIWCDFLKLRWTYKGPFKFRLRARIDHDILKFSDFCRHVAGYKNLLPAVAEQLAHPDALKNKREYSTSLFVGKKDGKASERIIEYLLNHS